MPRSDPGAGGSPSGVRSRTQRAILSAAVSVLTRDRAATLADIAQSADVGRSTLQRYFPDREALLTAVYADSVRVLDAVIATAEPDRGTPSQAIERLVPALFDLGDRVVFRYGDGWERATSAGDREIAALMRRGQDEGVFDPEPSAAWLTRVFWTVLGAGWQAVEAGELARPEAASMVLRALENGMRPG
ncbi:TetR family transcriptional regulator [Tamaricihabitans halophyticus]|uniref:TetR family transcriptional regulator n=1 Tax=Tamaricihabitans halophyticus TaxID=1262583 RepID=A0A4R2QVS4_9PSEU|nr:TetR/AcrR family transcriptional regulator [Tamaricihabitans halophyticus]TCP54180.1 TetR family transcriptional regulator [Tamaricihabitans halophyticus]